MVEAKEYEIETSITLDYRKSTWGLERMVLDGIANHLPEDSNGSQVAIKLKQDGNYVPLKEADSSKKTEEIVFEDDGSGYDAGMLSILFSSKAADALSVGQFGEGLKLVAAAALRNGINVEYKSKNWTAIPFARPVTIGKHNVEKLCFNVTENGEVLDGSRTVVRNPSDGFIEEVFQIPNKVLALNDSYTVLSKEGLTDDYLSKLLGKEIKRYQSRIIEFESGEKALFVKGVRVQGINSIFSYDLGLDNITPDRIFADRDKVLDSIENLLKSYASPEAIKKVLTVAHEEPFGNYDEFQAFYDRRKEPLGMMPMMSYATMLYRPKMDSLLYSFGDDDKVFLTYEEEQEMKRKFNPWAKAFYDLFGEDAVLASDDVNENRDAEIMGYKPIELNHAISHYLRDNGVEQASKLARETEYKWVDKGELKHPEKDLIDRVDEINEILLGESNPVNIRVYSGLFTKTGREIESSKGVHIRERDGSSYIGIRRTELQDLPTFLETYIHELGHEVTGKSDYDRGFTDFFVTSLAKVMTHYMAEENKVTQEKKGWSLLDLFRR